VNGREVVLGTALMLVGGNSRTVAAAAEARIQEINRTLPPGIRARTVLNRTQLVDATIETSRQISRSVRFWWCWFSFYSWAISALRSSPPW
jgi:Cu/Ag efflux pump CusA